VVGADDREAHRVLELLVDALGAVRPLGRAEEAGVGGDEQGAVLGVDAETVDVDGTCVVGAASAASVVLTARDGEQCCCDRRDGE
jgi:hypothetical protein